MKYHKARIVNNDFYLIYKTKKCIVYICMTKYY